ncbi:MAG: phosphopyruvate hydratase [Lachnospiraceae bacterium]|nr:phosphopyruvate hydratase [Lachnospiraceae bacterium]
MLDQITIKKVFAREILDSRAFPTVEAVVILSNGIAGRAAVPSGASTGRFEACELRDGGSRYMGKGVQKAVSHVNQQINRCLKGKSIHDLKAIDQMMLELDGTDNKSNLGANAVLSVSLAAAKAAAQSENLPLYRFLATDSAFHMPVPMMNILNGGKHAANTVDFQEFMIMPKNADSFKTGLRWCCEVYHSLQGILKSDHHNTGVGDEGGFAPDLKDAFEVFDYLTAAVEKAGYICGKDIVFAMDAAASELYQPDSGVYYFPGETQLLQEKNQIRRVEPERQTSNCMMPDCEALSVQRTSQEMIAYFEKLCDRYPLYSIEDGLDEEDWKGWKEFTEKIGRKTMLVGDDLFVTNRKRLEKGAAEKAANAILIKPNQIGTLSETMDTIDYARKNGYKTVMSHRSGETEDTTIADLAVALQTEYIKTGAPCRGERTAKYNRLLRIEEKICDVRRK